MMNITRIRSRTLIIVLFCVSGCSSNNYSSHTYKGTGSAPLYLDTSIKLSATYFAAQGQIERMTEPDTLSPKGLSDRAILPFKFDGISSGWYTPNISLVANDSQLMVQAMDTGKGEICLFDRQGKRCYHVMMEAVPPKYWALSDSLINTDTSGQIWNYNFVLNRFGQHLRNKQLPDFRLATIDGKILTQKDVQGKIVVINFWHFGCFPCMVQMPRLNELSGSYDTNRVMFVSFSRDSGYVKDGMKLFKTQMVAIEDDGSSKPIEQALPATIDFTTCINASGSMDRSFYIYADPATLIIDTKGIVRYQHSGYGPGMDDDIKAEVDFLLKTSPHFGLKK